MGERPPSFYAFFGWWLGASGDLPWFGATDCTLGVNEIDPNNQPEYVPEFYRPGQYNDPNDLDRWHYWSMHDQGGNWLLADGSVRFLTYSVGQTILPAMATYRGSEVVPSDY